MGRKYVIRDQQAVYFVTFTVVNWIDLFIRDEYREIIIQSLIYCQKNKGLRVHAYCIMSSHIHLIISAQPDCKLTDIIRDMKSYTSTALKKCIKEHSHESRREWLVWLFERAGKKNKRNNDFQLWQQHNHPIELTTKEMENQRLDYVHNNPVEAGFVNDPTAWQWSSCGLCRIYMKNSRFTF
jgi:putative transposase